MHWPTKKCYVLLRCVSIISDLEKKFALVKVRDLHKNNERERAKLSDEKNTIDLE